MNDKELPTPRTDALQNSMKHLCCTMGPDAYAYDKCLDHARQLERELAALRAAPSTPPAPASLAREETKEAVHDMTARESKDYADLVRRLYERSARATNDWHDETSKLLGEAMDAISVLSSRNPIPSSAALPPGDARGEGQGERVKELEALLRDLGDSQRRWIAKCAEESVALGKAHARIAELEAEVAGYKQGMALGQENCDAIFDEQKARIVSLERLLRRTLEQLHYWAGGMTTSGHDRMLRQLEEDIRAQLATPPAALPPARPATDGKDGAK